MPVDVLLFGAHPDDVEWGVGGIMLLLKAKGISFAIVDLTNGELGSRGTPGDRMVEARRAAEFLGLGELSGALDRAANAAQERMLDGLVSIWQVGGAN